MFPNGECSRQAHAGSQSMEEGEDAVIDTRDRHQRGMNPNGKSMWVSPHHRKGGVYAQKFSHRPIVGEHDPQRVKLSTPRSPESPPRENLGAPDQNHRGTNQGFSGH